MSKPKNGTVECVSVFGYLMPKSVYKEFENYRKSKPLWWKIFNIIGLVD